MKMFSALERKARVAYENGRMDFLAGASCDPETPLRIYDDLTPEQQAVIKQAWVLGWEDAKSTESLMDALPDGMPA
jgi:hypothetical protein